MIIYVVRGGSGSFEVFSNKKDAEKLKKELADESDQERYTPVWADVYKFTIKTKKELINVMNIHSGGWDQLQ
tara:strand:+ start:364 stop:579 length:216 start_codon:yes stop_codon:yes gene_type:complete